MDRGGRGGLALINLHLAFLVFLNLDIDTVMDTQYLESSIIITNGWFYCVSISP